MISENKKNNNNASMFMYTALIFFVALILIIISFFGQTNLDSKQPASAKKEIEQSQDMGEGITQRVSLLSRENVELINENKELNEQIESNKEIISSLTSENETLKINVSNYELLMSIYSYIEQNKEDEASSSFSDINYDTLTEEQKIVYDNLKNILNKEN